MNSGHLLLLNGATAQLSNLLTLVVSSLMSRIVGGGCKRVKDGLSLGQSGACASSSHWRLGNRLPSSRSLPSLLLYCTFVFSLLLNIPVSTGFLLLEGDVVQQHCANRKVTKCHEMNSVVYYPSSLIYKAEVKPLITLVLACI